MEKSVILFVDDDRDLLDVLALRYRARGYRVVTASDGDVVLSLIKRVRPSLVVLDVHMPNVDGLLALREIQEAAPELRVVAISGDASEKLGKLMLAEGARDFIVKPLDMRALDNSIDVNLLAASAE